MQKNILLQLVRDVLGKVSFIRQLMKSSFALKKYSEVRRFAVSALCTWMFSYPNEQPSKYTQKNAHMGRRRLGFPVYIRC